jgi:hypothetical protein
MEIATEVKSERLFARATPTLMQRVDAAAAAEKRDRSEWVRLIIEQHLDLRDRGFGPTIQALLSQPVSPR